MGTAIKKTKDSPPLDNDAIGDLFDETADLLEIQGENPFRVRAYRNAARTIRELDKPLAVLIQSPEFQLTNLPGIGKDLAQKVLDIFASGRLEILEVLRRKVPTGTRELLKVPGIGPKKALQLQRELNIRSLTSLRAAAAEHQLAKLKGFGSKTEDNILKGLTHVESTAGRMLLEEARTLAKALTDHLHPTPGLGQLVVAGSYRRRKETIGDLDLVATCRDPEKIMNRLAEYDEHAEILGRGPTKMSLRLGTGRQVDLRVIPDRSFGAALVYFTGSKTHNIELRRIAQGLGLKLNEYGIYKGATWLTGRTEEDVYRALGLAWIPPELREAHGEIELAAKGPLRRLVEGKDIRGDLHMHTVATDGRSSLAEMVAAARLRGYEYVAITDHSRRVTMAKGLDEIRLRRQWWEIDKLQASLQDITILKGVELDILDDGSLDLSKEILRQADWVIGAIHYGQRQPRKTITKRIVTAIRSGLINAVAHPTGRLISQRPAYAVDLEEVFKAAADFGCALEINGQPMRLDLDDVALNLATKYPIRFVLNSDAHSAIELDFMDFAVSQARRGGLVPSMAINTMSLKALRSIL